MHQSNPQQLSLEPGPASTDQLTLTRSGRSGDDTARLATGLQIRILGQIDMVVGGNVTAVPGERRQALLATLALHGGRAVSKDTLIDAVWSGQTPATVENTLQSHISYLRRLMRCPDTIVSCQPGYKLNLGENATDAHVFERSIAEAMQLADPRHKVPLLRNALSLWRGVPLGGIRGHVLLDEHADRLERLHHVASKGLTESRLVLGEHTAVIPELEDLVVRHPFDEDLGGQLMTALYRAGRQADALTVYRRLRARLADELGIDPGRALRELERAILRQEQYLETTMPANDHSTPDWSTRPAAQLPSAGSNLVGREPELSALNVIAAEDSGSPAVKTVVITGMPGIGTSALALRWCHEMRKDFPDGQLYIDLKGFNDGTASLSTARALRCFIEAMAGPGTRIPSDLGTMVGLYRTLLSGKRVLVLLDNAREAEQIRPLLPSSPGCMAVVTSRTELTSLAVTSDARLLHLRPLSANHSRTLLRHRLGTEGRDAPSKAIEEVVANCGGLPLALAIAAATPSLRMGLVQRHPDSPPMTALELLDALSGADPDTSLNTVFRASHRLLSGRAQTLFASLGEQADDIFTLISAADCSDLSEPESVEALKELTRMNLVERHGYDYWCHPLLRAFAYHLAERFPESEAC